MAKSGKQHELNLCRDTIKDPLMTLFQDYDWADEVQHARSGRVWGTAFGRPLSGICSGSQPGIQVHFGHEDVIAWR